MSRIFLAIAALGFGLVLSGCASLTPQGACSEQGLSEGTAAYEQCVADKTAAAKRARYNRPRRDHGR